MAAHGANFSERIEAAVEKFVEHRNPTDAVEINGGYCRQFAEFVQEEYDLPDSVEVIDAADVHTWLYYDGRHYDAEYTEGLPDIHEHPIWKRVMAERLAFAVESTDWLDETEFERLE